MMRMKNSYANYNTQAMRDIAKDRASKLASTTE
jgi:hypothetical protein